MNVWIAIHAPICGDCGRLALYETANEDWRAPAHVVCPYCGATGTAPRAVPVMLHDSRPVARGNNDT